MYLRTIASWKMMWKKKWNLCWHNKMIEIWHWTFLKYYTHKYIFLYIYNILGMPLSNFRWWELDMCLQVFPLILSNVMFFFWFHIFMYLYMCDGVRTWKIYEWCVHRHIGFGWILYLLLYEFLVVFIQNKYVDDDKWVFSISYVWFYTKFVRHTKHKSKMNHAEGKMLFR